MVRNYKRKTNKGSYDKDELRAAVQAVTNGIMSGYKAAKVYSIPRTTILDHVHRKSSSNILGRKPAIPLATELNLAKCLHIMEKYGFGLSRAEIIELVGQYINRNNLKTCFKNGIPGKDWLTSFQNRHNLSIKKPQPVEYARKVAVDPFVVYGYFDLLKKTITELGLQHKPQAIWNLDETSFCKDPLKTKVVGLKGHAAIRVIATPGKDNTTVLLGASAVGEKTPPLIIFKGKYLWDAWSSPDAYPGTTYAATKNGWMEADVFEAFFKKSFLPTVGTERPILLIYDGHSTHVGLNIIQEARKENITILKLPPHTSHILQPLDLSVMKSFKSRWDVELVKWQRLNIGVPMPKKEFSRVIGSVWAQIDKQVLCNGFKKAGIYPFDSRTIEESTFDILKLSRWKKHLFSNEANNSIQNSPLPDTDHLMHLAHICKPPNIVISSLDQSPKSLLSSVIHFLNKTYITTGCQFKVNCSNVEPNQLVVKRPFENKEITFEELLLQKVKPGDKSQVKRSRVASGAEVITNEDVVKIKIEKESKVKNNLRKKTSNKSQKHANDVVLISNATKSNKEFQPFIAQNINDIPRCLRNESTGSRRVNIISNIVLKPSIPSRDIIDQPGPSDMQNKVPSIGKKRVTNKMATSFKIKNKINTTLTAKGKGIGKKTRGKENKTPSVHIEDTTDDFKFIIMKKQKKSTSGSTTSVSGTLSCHSDSDLINFETDTEFKNDFDEKTQIYEGTNFDKTAINKKTDIVNRNKHEDNENNHIDTNYNMPNYYINDHVLVRYYLRNKWTYYVGVIEAIHPTNSADEQTYYSVKFYKTMKQPNLFFKMPKRIDRDDVPTMSIVKTVSLCKNKKNTNHFMLINEDDTVYFC